MTTAGDVLVQTLVEWGVDTVFGLPGDGINGVMESLRQRQRDIRFIQVRHEEAGAFMACGYAKFTGRLGVCLATSGPGAIHLLNGLYDAKLDGQPVLAITGSPFHDLVGTMTQQDVQVDRLFEDVSIYNARVSGPAHIENVVHLACRSALSQRGVAHVTIPVDVQSMPLRYDTRSERNEQDHANAHSAPTYPLPSPIELDRAAEILNQSKRLAILVGRGALGAGHEIEVLAELRGAPVIKALLGKAVIPDDSPYTTGGIGLLGTRPSQEAMEECDTLLMIGTSFPYLEFYPKVGQARCVQIDSDPVRIGLRYPVDAALIGDAKLTLHELLPRIQSTSDQSFLRLSQARMDDWWKLMDERGSRMDRPMKPQVVARELSERLADDAIVVADSGTVATWFARHVRARRDQMFSLSGTLASMGNGLPYAIAASIAHPGRQVIAMVGDGALSMLMGDLATAVKYRLPIKVIVMKNNTLGMIKWEQMVMLGNPEYACELQPIDFVGIARAFGATGFTCDDPVRIGEILDEALAVAGPVVVEAVVDPHEPPLPPKISGRQARRFTEALVRGQPDRMDISLTLLKDTVRELT